MARSALIWIFLAVLGVAAGIFFAVVAIAAFTVAIVIRLVIWLFYAIVWGGKDMLLTIITTPRPDESPFEQLTAEDDFPHPAWKGPDGTPCSECHLHPGETCDICGARRPAESTEDRG